MPEALARLAQRPISTGLAAAAILATGLWWSGRDVSALFLTEAAVGPEPWRLLTSVLPHVTLWHIAFNVYWLLKVGGAIEDLCGARLSIALVLATAIGSGALELALFEGGVGLSGVGYGQVAFAWLASAREPRLRAVVDGRVVQLFAAWFVICVAMTVMGTYPVANAAHAGGAIVGALAGLAWARGPHAGPASVGLALATIAPIALASPPVRPLVNLSDPARSLVVDAFELSERDPAGAVALYERALELDPESADAHAGIGYALQREDPERALRELERALEIDPDRPELPEAIASVEYELARRAIEGGRPEEGIQRLERAIEIAPRAPHEALAAYWIALAAARIDAGDRDGARRALREAESYGTTGDFADWVRAELSR